ncbi:MAG: hypothetical protein M3O09_15645 [Acidobacteriota bacterium]|nr:hypothetical protein [Acidobacteriota bacterium]
MRNLKFRIHRPSDGGVMRNDERGIALLTVLLALLLITAIGFGILFMANTETAVNANYRDTQVGFFAMRSGLEEVRDRLRSNSINPLTLPTTMPGSAGSIVYITNPAGVTDVVAPATAGNAYFDDEFCHEAFTTSPLTNPGVNIPCPTSSAPPAGSVVNVASVAPYTNTAAALPFKWVRITKKQNGTVANAPVDAAQPLSAEVCYNSMNSYEIPITAVPGGYASCTQAQAAAAGVSPVYIVTSLAITPKGTRRIGQYEVAGISITPPPGALGLDGPGATFSPRPSSNQFFIAGADSGAAGYAAWGGPGSCTPAGPGTVPAIGTGDAAGAAAVTASLTSNPNRSGNYTGTGGTPSVVNEGVGGNGLYGGGWANPATLNNLVTSLSNGADVSYSCGIGSPCSPAGPVGTNANPQITFVNGDFNYGNSSGAGLLIVTGTLSFTGNATFNGLILVIGQGVFSESGGGNGGFNGSVFIAKTNSSTAPYAALASLGAPAIHWNGGGNSQIQYNSCWANIGNQLHYAVISTHEEMY